MWTLALDMKMLRYIAYAHMVGSELLKTVDSLLFLHPSGRTLLNGDERCTVRDNLLNDVLTLVFNLTHPY